ncbi:hypothetical protein NUW58_g542 [Xylaria curta]|uniref:Uncharacterized protein n=1 Tax=Xylaria curta TaxID=42375 RepID=A0ACC1PRE7_9PEZI|nr:hypothetical protein NUW58_g542 [Xylaria curta]
MSQAIAPLTRITTACRVQENHAAFLGHFAAREAQSRAVKQKSTLSVKQHASHRAQLSKVHFIKPKYSQETEINVSGIFKKWKSYCEDLRVGDWEATIKGLKRETTQHFFLYVCENSKITSRGSGEEYIRQFQQLYTTASDENSQLLESLLFQETLGRGRPKALCYEDIQMMVVRHPVTGRCIPAMAIKFVYYKGADNKPKPTIFYFSPTRKLIFCAVSTILSLALHDKAFDAPSLTNASAIFSKKPPRSQQCIPLGWKESMLKTPVFRRYRGASLSGAEAMLYSKLRDDIGQQSLDSGHEKRWTPRFARRGAANAANGDAPDSVRDQMMRHDPQFVTFHRAYLNEIANFDLQNAFLEEEKESQLFRLFAHVSLTRDPRATADMVPEEVWANLAPDPEIVELEKERARLKQDHYRIEGHKEEEKIRKLSNEIRIKRAQRDRQVVREYREHYFYHRPTWDIGGRARGEEEEEYVEPAINVSIPGRAKLAEILCQQLDNLTEDAILQQRIEVIDLMVALCDKRETVKRDRIQHRAKACPPIKTESVEPGPDPDDFPLLMHAAQCPDCIGDERLSLEERAFTYCRPHVMNDHFDNQHLVRREQAEQSEDKIRFMVLLCGRRSK